MNPKSVYRAIAVITGFIGLLLASATAFLIVVLINSSEKTPYFYSVSMVAFFALIATGLIWTSAAFLRAPTKEKALLLATNSSAVIWAFSYAAISSTAVPKITGPAHIVLSITIAYLAHRFVLKPLALRVMPLNTPKTERSE